MRAQTETAEREDFARHSDYARRTVDAYFAALRLIARARGWTGFSIAPTIRGEGGADDYLDEFGFPADQLFAHLKNLVLNLIERDARRLRDLLVREFLVDEARLEAAERDILGGA